MHDLCFLSVGFADGGVSGFFVLCLCLIHMKSQPSPEEIYKICSYLNYTIHTRLPGASVHVCVGVKKHVIGVWAVFHCLANTCKHSTAVV